MHRFSVVLPIELVYIIFEHFLYRDFGHAMPTNLLTDIAWNQQMLQSAEAFFEDRIEDFEGLPFFV